MGSRRRGEDHQGRAIARFRHAVVEVVQRYSKRTSAQHKRFVAFLILGGALLRGYMLFRPITADEALAYMSFAVLPTGELLSNYGHPINHIFHTLLTKASTGVLGTGLVSLRLPAFIAGVLVLPFFYLFVRAMFNRYIAVMALALCAASPNLIEQSALAHGYSIGWLCLVIALVLGRHLIRSNERVPAVLIGLVCAIGMWSIPSLLNAVIMVHVWLLISLLSKYERSLGDRLATLGLSAGVFLVATVLFYLPVIMGHGVDQLFHHVTEERHTWAKFSVNYPEEVLGVWVWIVDPTYWWVAVLGFAGLVQAAYISVKFRSLVFAMAIGAIPIVLLQATTGQSGEWGYTLLIYHLGMAIAAFYLLKFVQEKLFPSLSKRTRTTWASLVLFAGFAVPGMSVIYERTPRLPQARACAEFLNGAMAAGDRACIDPVWQAPVGFHLRILGHDLTELTGTPKPGRLQIAVMATPHGTSFRNLLYRCVQRPGYYQEPYLMKEWPGMEIFAAHLREDASVGEAH